MKNALWIALIPLWILLGILLIGVLVIWLIYLSVMDWLEQRFSYFARKKVAREAAYLKRLRDDTFARGYCCRSEPHCEYCPWKGKGPEHSC